MDTPGCQLARRVNLYDRICVLRYTSDKVRYSRCIAPGMHYYFDDASVSAHAELDDFATQGAPSKEHTPMKPCVPA